MGGGDGLDLGDTRPQLGWGVHAAPLACTGETGHVPVPGARQSHCHPQQGHVLKQLARASVHEAGDLWDQFGGLGVAACPTGLLAWQGEGCIAPSHNDLHVAAGGDRDDHTVPTLPWVRIL